MARPGQDLPTTDGSIGIRGLHPPSVDLVIMDDMMPSELSPFRILEYEHYLRTFDAVLLSYERWHPWFPDLSFQEALDRLSVEDGIKTRIHPFKLGKGIEARLAYVTFLHNALVVLPWLQSRSVPFVLQLYPGGGFEIGQALGDTRLRRVLESPLLRRVIVTQSVSQEYLIEDMHYPADRVALIYGAVVDNRGAFSFARDKTFYPRDKATLDMCFVAHRYGRQDLTSKGYDQFVAIGKGLLELGLQHIRFHVVGGYQPDDVPLGDMAGYSTFYGIRDRSFFRDFYPRMDCIVSVNRPFVRAPGNFDGFPTAACMEAGLRGVLNCVSDPLRLNPRFRDGEDIMLLTEDSDASVRRLASLVRSPARLYDLAYSNYRSFQRAFDTDDQLRQRSWLITEELART